MATSSRALRIFPPRPDLAKARSLAAGLTPAAVVLYTCDASPCDQQAQIIKSNLAAIGLHVQVKTFPDTILFARASKRGEPYDMVWVGWVADYHDPAAMLNVLLEGTVLPTFAAPAYRRALAVAARLTGPSRYLTYARLDADLARHQAPLIAYGNLTADDFFSERIGCQTFGLFGMDLAALCLRHGR